MTTVSTHVTGASLTYLLGTGQVFNLTPTGSISATFGVIFSGDVATSNTTFNILGPAVAEFTVQISVDRASRITIGPDGLLADGASDSVLIETRNTGSGGSTIVNHGTMLASAGLMRLRGGDNTVVNTGTMTGNTFGILAGLFGPRDTVTNHGTITVLSETVGNAMSGHGVLFDAVGHTLLNIGAISVHGAGKSGVLINQPGGTGSIANSGLIHARDGAAVSANANAGAVRLDNSGTLERGTPGAAVTLGAGADLLVNTGRIKGDVQMGAGNDTIDLRGGRVEGTVAGGAGDDLYRVSDAGARLVELAGGGTDTVEAGVDWTLAPEFEVLQLVGAAVVGVGNALGNTITGTAAANLLSGLGGDDSLFGGNGNDTLDGGAGNDQLFGGEEDDLLSGRAGNDRIEGGAGDDTLRGQAGNDVLLGGDGEDVLVGGAGRDRMAGGADADRFVFVSSSETAPGAARDVVVDFEQGHDRIDLSRIDARTNNTTADDAFAFIGTAAFTSAGQVRYTVVGGITVIAFETTGDGVADGEIELTGVYALTAGDFVL